MVAVVVIVVFVAAVVVAAAATAAVEEILCFSFGLSTSQCPDRPQLSIMNGYQLQRREIRQKRVQQPLIPLYSRGCRTLAVP